MTTKYIFLHGITDEIIHINTEKIVFYGPTEHKPVVKEAIFETKNGQRLCTREPEYGSPVEVTQIVTEKGTFNVTENFREVTDMLLMYGFICAIEKEGPRLYTKLQGAGKGGSTDTKIHA